MAKATEPKGPNRLRAMATRAVEPPPGHRAMGLLRASRFARLGLLAGTGAAIAIVSWQSDAIWESMGYGLGVAVALGMLFLGVFFSHPLDLFRHWNRWLGLTLWGLAAWGALAFYDAGSGLLMDASLGGDIGTGIIGERNGTGVFIVTALSIAGFVFLLPTLTRHLLTRTIAGTDHAMTMAIKTADATSKKAGPLLTAGAHRLQDAIRRISASWVRPSGRATTADDGSHQPKSAPVLEWTDQIEDERVSPTTADRALPSDDHVEAPFDDVEDQALGVDKDAVQAEAEEDVPSSVAIVDEEAPPLILESIEAPGGWRLPAMEILDYSAVSVPSGADNQARAQRIEDALASYGIEAKVVEINPGPAVTQFGVEPGWVRRFKDVRVRDADGKYRVDEDGKPVVRREEVSRTRVKVDAIANLDKDLALALAAPSIRIEAPVPGKSMVGIEVPNSSSEVVSLRGILETPTFAKLHGKSKLAVALGKGSGGDPTVADLGKMPHVLIAGATGSGKSVCINAFLISLLMNNTPAELRLMLIDPKRVELVAYNSVPHLLTPVIVETDKAVSGLRWAIAEMEDRYKKLSSVGARNLGAYNQHRKVVDPLPYIVIAVDELADLMMAAPYDVEHCLTRLAQLGRATGIHLVVATQRPSVDVVTGLIKANFPTRMSFAVTSVTDSRTILDTGGAEKLLGKGDSLYLPQDAPKPIRIQGVFVSDREIERVVRAWNSQSVARMPDYVRLEEDGGTSATAAVGAFGKDQAGDDSSDDPLYEDAKNLAEQYSKLSPSLLQRRLKIGYTKAKRLIEALERDGYIEVAQEISL